MGSTIRMGGTLYEAVDLGAPDGWVRQDVGDGTRAYVRAVDGTTAIVDPRTPDVVEVTVLYESDGVSDRRHAIPWAGSVASGDPDAVAEALVPALDEALRDLDRTLDSDLKGWWSDFSAPAMAIALARSPRTYGAIMDELDAFSVTVTSALNLAGMRVTEL